MNPRRPASPTPAARGKRHRAGDALPRRSPHAQSGFTLFATSLVFALISVVLAFAIPLARQLLIDARVAAVEHDLRTFAAAFQTCAHARGDWPPGDGSPRTLPPEMSTYLPETAWSKPTPLGGHYAWDPHSRHQGSRHRAVIVLASTPDNPVTRDRRQLLALDARIDDGDLSTGHLQLGYRNQPIYILEH
jgi:Type II secretory pathway, pseudopilin PulG